MPLSFYHQKQAQLSDDDIKKRAVAKKDELRAIFNQVSLKTGSAIVRVAVLGCADRRFIPLHKHIFRTIVGKPVEVTTFDITIEHLAGEERVVEHDCTQALPNGPFDIIYVHVLLKFIETEKQWNVIENSYTALKAGGLALHILDREDYETQAEKLGDGYWAVPLSRWKTNLISDKIAFREIPVKYGEALIIQR